MGTARAFWRTGSAARAPVTKPCKALGISDHAAHAWLLAYDRATEPVRAFHRRTEPGLLRLEAAPG